jgi:hypothetical protein
VQSETDASVDASEPPVEPIPDAGETEPEPNPLCWTLELTNSASVSDASSCLGLSGWNDIAVDGSTDVEISYQGGDVCFAGSVVDDGWGAVYDMELSAGNAWNAAALGVGGFAFDMSGTTYPPSLEIIYDGGADFCRAIPVGGSAELLFADTHPDCAASGSSPNPANLTNVRIVFPVPGSGSYPVAFCIRFRALPVP